MKLWILIGILVVSSGSWAAITFRVENMSATASPNGTALYYYSNIFTNQNADNTHWIDNDGGECSTILNPDCRKSSDSLIVYATPSITTGCLVLTAGASAVSTSNTSFTALASVTPAAGENTLTATFGALCTEANTRGLGVTTTCSSDNDIDSKTIHVSIVSDKSCDSQFTSDEEVASFQLIIKSAIVKQAGRAGDGGVYQFTMIPGDEKAKIRDVFFDTNFPKTVGGIGIRAVRIYHTSGTANYDPTVFNQVAVGTSPYFETGVNGETGEFNESAVTGLTNDIYHYFKVALVDNAGNIGYVSDNSYDAIESHAALPSQVIGLLSEQYGCFISTAAFGSPMANQVVTLKKFRDMFLLKTNWGKRLVSMYYENSPPLAKKIATNPSLRKATRVALYPIVGFAWMAVNWGGKNAALFTAILLMLPILAFQVFSRYRKPRAPR